MDRAAVVQALERLLATDGIGGADPTAIGRSAPELERFLTTDDIAARYKTRPGTVRYWRHVGFGPRGAKVGRRYLYPESEVRRFDAELLAQAAGESA